MIMEKNKMAISQSRNEKIVLALHSAYEENGMLNKTLTVHNDVFESWELALRFYKFSGELR